MQPQKITDLLVGIMPSPVGGKYGLIAVSVLSDKMFEGRCRGAALSLGDGRPFERIRWPPASVMQIPYPPDKPGPSDVS